MHQSSRMLCNRATTPQVQSQLQGSNPSHCMPSTMLLERSFREVFEHCGVPILGPFSSHSLQMISSQCSLVPRCSRKRNRGYTAYARTMYPRRSFPYLFREHLATLSLHTIHVPMPRLSRSNRKRKRIHQHNGNM